MRIDKKLNLVVPVDADGGTVYVHSTPLSREVFEQYFMVISRTFADIYRQRLELVAGPRVAMMLLRRVAREQGVLDGPDGVDRVLIPEIRRLTTVAIPGDRGFEHYPLQDVIDRTLLSEEDIAEVEGVVTFFICASAMHRRAELPIILDGMGSLWGAQTTSFSLTEYIASLPKSTEDMTSPTTTSSVPS